MPPLHTTAFLAGSVFSFLALLHYYTNDNAAGAVVSGTVLALLLIWYIPAWQVRKRIGSDDSRDYVELVSEPRKTMLQVVGGVFLLAGLYFTAQQIQLERTAHLERLTAEREENRLQREADRALHLERLEDERAENRKQREADRAAHLERIQEEREENHKQREADRKEHQERLQANRKADSIRIAAENSAHLERLQTDREANREKLITEQFIKAMQLLKDSANVTARLGGIFALERIAKGSQKDHWTIMEVLTTYVRDKRPRLSQGYGAPVPSDIRAIMQVLGRRHWRSGEQWKLYLADTDLRLVQIPEAQLDSSDLRWCCLHKADLREVSLRGAGLRKADMRSAFLLNADLSGAFMMEAVLDSANLRRANLSMTDLNNAYLNYAKLERASLCNANLQGASMQYAGLYNADLADANMAYADLNGADLDFANLTGANLSFANLADARYLDVEQLFSAATLFNATYDRSLHEKMLRQDSAKYVELNSDPFELLIDR